MDEVYSTSPGMHMGEAAVSVVVVHIIYENILQANQCNHTSTM